MNNKLMKVYVFLHILLLIYSTSGIFSKMAAGQVWGSASFAACYVGMLMVMFIYAIGWQQVIKHLPLSVAFAHRPVIVIWGMMWGWLIFEERLNLTNFIGAMLIIIGIEIYSSSEKIDGDG